MCHSKVTIQTSEEYKMKQLLAGLTMIVAGCGGTAVHAAQPDLAQTLETKKSDPTCRDVFVNENYSPSTNYDACSIAEKVFTRLNDQLCKRELDIIGTRIIGGSIIQNPRHEIQLKSSSGDRYVLNVPLGLPLILEVPSYVDALFTDGQGITGYPRAVSVQMFQGSSMSMEMSNSFKDVSSLACYNRDKK